MSGYWTWAWLCFAVWQLVRLFRPSWGEVNFWLVIWLITKFVQVSLVSSHLKRDSLGYLKQGCMRYLSIVGSRWPLTWLQFEEADMKAKQHNLSYLQRGTPNKKKIYISLNIFTTFRSDSPFWRETEVFISIYALFKSQQKHDFTSQNTGISTPPPPFVKFVCVIVQRWCFKHGNSDLRMLITADQGDSRAVTPMFCKVKTSG